jgi:hypothetical protein
MRVDLSPSVFSPEERSLPSNLWHSRCNSKIGRKTNLKKKNYEKYHSCLSKPEKLVRTDIPCAALASRSPDSGFNPYLSVSGLTAVFTDIK